MIGNVLIAIGVVSFACGVTLRFRDGRAPAAVVQTEVPVYSIEVSATADEDNFKKGQDFEKWVVSKFNSRYFRVLEWRSDKVSHGHYAESSRLPDLEIEFAFHEEQSRFAVECKWRKNFYKSGIEWSYPAQVESYRGFASERHMPVFVVIGVGGSPGDPNDVFVIPLGDLTGPFVTKSALRQYRRNNANRNFFLDVRAGSLK